MDASGDQNHEVDERVWQAILGEDPELITDLRPSGTFDVFFGELEKIVEELTAADERRHGVAHLSHFISVKDLIKKVTALCPNGTPIPSGTTVLFAFTPKSGRLKLQFKVQSRQLRASHVDQHYCAALFKYMRMYAVKYHEFTSFLCIDDKAKVDYGEPGSAISSGVCGKKSIVPVF